MKTWLFRAACWFGAVGLVAGLLAFERLGAAQSELAGERAASWALIVVSLAAVLAIAPFKVRKPGLRAFLVAGLVMLLSFVDAVHLRQLDQEFRYPPLPWASEAFAFRLWIGGGLSAFFTGLAVLMVGQWKQDGNAAR